MEAKSGWGIAQPDEPLARMLARELGISITLGRLLTVRGIASLEQARRFLTCTMDDLTNPWQIGGMTQAVARIERAIDSAEPIIIYGDYDADGVCSTVLMVQCLRRLGARVEYYLPDRFSEGYGLNMKAMEKLAGLDYRLLITVDNGISSYYEIQRGRELGLDIIITDHHTPPTEVPPALAIVNPRLDMLQGSADLAGVGVVFQLCRALGQDRIGHDEIMAWLDLVALATVADAVPLKGDNRILVKHGLQRMKNSTNLGLRSLLKASGLDNRELAAWHLAFVLGPRINAAGRLKSAGLVAELFLSSNENEADEMAAGLCELNIQRRSVEEGVTQAAIAFIEEQIDLNEELVLVVGGEGWHQGVIGIVASRIAERYNRPAIIISWEGDDGKGSCRSLPGFNLYEALSENASWLQHFGGHKLAAGLSLQRRNYEGFRRDINDWAGKQAVPLAYQLQQSVDLELSREEITIDLVREIRLLEPYGEDNPAPRFVMQGIKLESFQLMGKGLEHFRCKAAGFDGVAFGRPDFMKPSLSYLNQDLVFGLEENEFRGKRSIQLRINDIKPSVSTIGLYSRNPGDGWLSAMMVMLQGQLEQGRNVILTYPTSRLLNKQKMIFKRFFPAEVVEEMHGCMPYNRRMRAERRFGDGSIKVCLTTNSYLGYYLQSHTLTEHSCHIIQLWTTPTGGEWREQLEKYQHTVWHWVPRHRFQVNRDWTLQKNRRTFIYSNRPTTLKNLTQDVPGMYIEVGLDVPEKRDAIRQSFLSGESGILLSDGAYAGLFNQQVIEEMVFADLPFSEYEALAVLNQIAADQDTTIFATFGADAIDFNRSHLERSFPTGELVKTIWNCLARRDQELVKTSFEALASELKPELGRGVSPLEIEAVLCILADLGLCETEKKGSIMAIKLRNTATAEFDLCDSPYYLEGLAEKKSFASWLERLNELYAW